MAKVPLSPGMATFLRGLSGRCPCCGQGRMFGRFLKVVDQCAACGEELHHQRADDFPAYIVIVIVGHVVVTAMVFVETNFSLSYGTQIFLWPSLTLILALALLQPTKGAVIALQWNLGMHGFEQAKRAKRAAVERD